MTFFGESFGFFLVKLFGVTRLEHPKGMKDKVKQTQWAQSRSGSGVGGLEVGAQQAPRLLVILYLKGAKGKW